MMSLPFHSLIVCSEMEKIDWIPICSRHKDWFDIKTFSFFNPSSAKTPSEYFVQEPLHNCHTPLRTGVIVLIILSCPFPGDTWSSMFNPHDMSTVNISQISCGRILKNCSVHWQSITDVIIYRKTAGSSHSGVVGNSEDAHVENHFMYFPFFF